MPQSPDFGLRESSVHFPSGLMAGPEATGKKHAADDYKPGCAKRVDGRVRKQPESDAANETDAPQVEQIDPTRPRSREVRHAETSIPPYWHKRLAQKTVQQHLEQLRGSSCRSTPDLQVFVITKDELRGWIRAIEWVLQGRAVK